MHIPREIARELKRQQNEKISDTRLKVGHCIGTIGAGGSLRLDDFRHSVPYSTLRGVSLSQGDRVLVAIVKGGKSFVVEGVLR